MIDVTVRQEIERASEVLLQLQEVGDALAFQADSLTIESSSDVEAGRKMLSEIGTVKKKIEAYTKPVKKAFNDFIKGFSESVTRADDLIRKKLNDFAAEQERIRREQEAKIRRQQEEERQRQEEERKKLEAQGKPVPPPPPPPPPVHVETPVDEGFRKNWKWKVEDESKIPEEYWLRVLDEKRLTREVIEQKEDFKVPGIKAYFERGGVAAR